MHGSHLVQTFICNISICSIVARDVLRCKKLQKVVKLVHSCAFACAGPPRLVLLCVSVQSDFWEDSLQTMSDDSETESDDSETESEDPRVMSGILDSHGEYDSAEIWDQPDNSVGISSAMPQHEGKSALHASSNSSRSRSSKDC